MSVMAFRRNISGSLRCFSLLLLVLLLCIGSPSIRTAHADEVYYFAQIACAPELGYFSIRRFFVLDLPANGSYRTEGLEPGPAAVAALQRKYRIFDSKSLQDRPFECSILPVQATQGWHEGRPGYKVRVVGHHDKNGQESDYHMIADNAEVLLQGTSLGLIVLNLSEGIDSIEVWYDALLEVRTCRVTPGTDRGNAQDLACRYEPFKAGAQ